MKIRRLNSIFLILCIGNLLCISCRTGSEKEIAILVPPLQSEVTYFLGSLISGSALIDTNSLAIERTAAVSVKIEALKKHPEKSLEPLESHTSMITIVPANEIIVPTGRLTKGSRIGTIDNVDKFFEDVISKNNSSTKYQVLHGVLAEDITTKFHFFVPGSQESQPSDGFTVALYRRKPIQEQVSGQSMDGNSLEIALVANGKAIPTTTEDRAAENIDKQNTKPVQKEQITETVVLKPWPVDGSKQIGIILPSPFSTGDVETFAVAITVSLGSNESAAEAEIHTKSFRQFQDYMSRHDFRDRNLPGISRAVEWSGLEEAVMSLRYPTSRRQILLYLAQQTRASIVEDIALTGTQTLLDNLSQSVIKDCPSGRIGDSNELGWILERDTYNLLKNMMSSEEMPPELESILIRHAGAVGRSSSMLEDILANTANLEDFQNRLISENLIYLEDMSPAVRTRAFEWLSVRNRAPEGFNPLASLKERRDVLNRLENSSQSK